MNDVRGNRLGILLVVVALALGALAFPAFATPDTGDGHTVTICHVTNSATNEFVEITVDVAAFDGEGSDDHTHHVNKYGNSDFVLEAGNTCADGPGGGIG